jgi:hypothetical protein
MLIKAGFSRQIATDGAIRAASPKVNVGYGNGGIGSIVRDESDYEKHVDYVHCNP